MPVSIDVDAYARRAESFIGDIDREYYLHFAGFKESFEIEAIYDRYSTLFDRAAVDGLRELSHSAEREAARRLRALLLLAVEGFIGRETKAEAAAMAEREATLEVEFDGRREPYRQVAIVQSNEPDAERRAEIERVRLEALDTELNPLLREIIERSHALAVELGWRSYRAMYEDLKGTDLPALASQTAAFEQATEARYRELVEPQLVAETGLGFDSLRRSDLPWFFRAGSYDRLFPAERLIEAFERTLTGLGIDLAQQSNVTLDIEQRPRKSPRAFCAAVHVPREVYLVIPRRGGRDDFAALLHEGGHAEHYAHVDASLPFEFRYLGDNSVTEGFAFLFEHLTEDPAWLEDVLGADDTGPYLEYVRANKLIFLRRYAAKLAYELELHDTGARLDRMPSLYAEHLSRAVGVDWPALNYLADVDDGYYCANYLRAWAFEARLRSLLRERFGERWYASREAGDLLRDLWREGQRRDADELLDDLTGEPLDFTVMLEEVLT